MLAFFALQIFVYDTLGMPLMTVMIAIGAVAREQLVNGPQPRTADGACVGTPRAWWPMLLVLTLLGAVGGAAVPPRAPVHQATKVSILLAQPPVYLDALDTGEDSSSSPGDVTIDTEAALLISRSR